jgi:hypothetical protein
MAAMLAHNSVVLPDPGLDIRLNAVTPCARKWARLRRASRLFSPRMSASICTARVGLMPGTDMPAGLPL